MRNAEAESDLKVRASPGRDFCVRPAGQSWGQFVRAASSLQAAISYRRSAFADRQAEVVVLVTEVGSGSEESFRLQFGV